MSDYNNFITLSIQLFNITLEGLNILKIITRSYKIS